MYGISIANGGRITLKQLREAATVAERADIVASLDRLDRAGIRYSNEDTDVLGRAWAALGWPRIDR